MIKDERKYFEDVLNNNGKDRVEELLMLFSKIKNLLDEYSLSETETKAILQIICPNVMDSENKILRQFTEYLRCRS